MNVSALNVTPAKAQEALLQYRAHRNTYDARDWEIERIYRQIAKGKTVISVRDAIVRGGIDEHGRPRLAIMRADQEAVRCDAWRTEGVRFLNEHNRRASDMLFEIPWPNRAKTSNWNLRALLPRIPPQHRPPVSDLSAYHILWEADWSTIPRDPYLLKRIGKDAWVVLAAWDLTDVEVSVLRAHQ